MAARSGGVVGAMRDLAGAVVPMSTRSLANEIDERLARIPTELNEFGIDRFGLNLETARRTLLPSCWLFRHYFRSECFGIEQVPAGRVLLIANHAGQLPFDGAMLGAAMVLEAEPPRVMRAMGEYWIPQLPFVSKLATETGALVGTPENARALLEAEECVAVFPEGVRGMNKTFDQRYRLQRFGTGFLRLALETNTPIVPGRHRGQRRAATRLRQPVEGLEQDAFGIPAFPITVGFPWLGPLGLLPLPVRYRIHFGAPMDFDGDANDEDARIDAHVERVRLAIEGLLSEGRSKREGIFT